MWDSIFKVLSGPLLAKLALAAILIAVFFFLRKKEAEGAMLGYAILGCFLPLRDLVFAYLPNAFLFNASDLLLLGSLLYISIRPFRLGWPFWIVAFLDGAAVVVLILESLGLDFGLAPDLVRLAALNH